MYINHHKPRGMMRDRGDAGGFEEMVILERVHTVDQIPKRKEHHLDGLAFKRS